MSLGITPIKNLTPVSFKQKVEHKTSGDENPISRKGETMLLLGSTFVGGLALGAKLLFELWDFGFDDTASFLLEKANKQGEKMVNRAHQGVSGNKKALMVLGATGAIILGALSGFAILYTVLNSPKIAYNSKINTFQKGKEMDVYIKSNEAENAIYKEIDDRAKNANEEDKEKLREQYMKMKMAKNQVPDFVKLKR